MIYSMTGYGAAVGVSGDLEIQVELRAVNNRHMDIAVRMPRLYLFAEDALKKQIAKSVARGKVDVFVHVEKQAQSQVEIEADSALVAGYLKAFEELSEQFSLKNEVGVLEIARMPDVLRIKRDETDTKAFSEDLLGITENALTAFHHMRQTEGEKLKEDIAGRLCTIETLAAEIERMSPETVIAYREKLEKRIREILENVQIEESRMLTEAALFADKVAVDEEITRLRSHLAQFREMLDEGGQIGRKLDFLLQELGREMNTIGSKCSDLEIGKMVINGKAELEKIREQVQNIE